MEKTKQRLNNIVETIRDSFPDEHDLKGFLGISREMIIEILKESDAVLDTLKEYNNDFGMILLKRELADLLGKIENELSEKYDKIKPGKFDLVLKWIAKVRYLIRDTYFLFTSEVPIRSEIQIAQANEELKSLSANIQELKGINPELLKLKDELVSEVSKYHEEISSQKDAAMLGIQENKTAVDSLKDTVISNIDRIHAEVKEVKETITVISQEVVEKQGNVNENDKKVAEASEGIEKHKSEISEIQSNVVEWENEIIATKERISSNDNEYISLNKKSQSLQNEIESTYEKVVGKKDESGKVTKGYIHEIEELRNQATDYLNEQKTKFSTQFKEIEALLPGATSIGLAEAYQLQKNSYKKPIRYWSTVFIITISSMAIFSLALIYMQFQIKSQLTLQEAIIAFLKDIPFFIPTIWLAAYASKQQSQYKRLEQEYAFKETNAKSFHGHKMQIEELMKEAQADQDLLMQLVQQLVVITGQNPSATLDSKSHDDSHPILRSVERLIPARRTANNESDGKEKVS